MFNVAQKRMSASMYEVFHWGNSECPKKLAFSIAGSHIDIDEPCSSAPSKTIRNCNSNSKTVKGEEGLLKKLCAR